MLGGAHRGVCANVDGGEVGGMMDSKKETKYRYAPITCPDCDGKLRYIGQALMADIYGYVCEKCGKKYKATMPPIPVTHVG